MQPKVASLVEKYRWLVARQNVQEDSFDGGAFRGSDVGEELLQQKGSDAVASIGASHSQTEDVTHQRILLETRT